MLTREDARLRVGLELRSRHGHRRGPEELVIVDEHVTEHAWGWVFPYTNRGWLDRDERYAVGGNSPIIFNRHDGTIRYCGTALLTEHYMREYEEAYPTRAGS